MASAEAAGKLQDEDIIINKKSATVSRAGKKIHFINVFNTPQEMSDDAVSSKLSYFGVIQPHRRGHWQSHPEWENRVRHYRMELSHTIP